jgi:hypothetical protein
MAAGVVGTPLTCIYFECIIMDKQEEPPIKSVSIRIPVDMLARLHQVAKQHNRSPLTASY